MIDVDGTRQKVVWGRPGWLRRRWKVFVHPKRMYRSGTNREGKSGKMAVRTARAHGQGHSPCYNTLCSSLDIFNMTHELGCFCITMSCVSKRWTCIVCHCSVKSCGLHIICWWLPFSISAAVVLLWTSCCCCVILSLFSQLFRVINWLSASMFGGTLSLTQSIQYVTLPFPSVLWLVGPTWFPAAVVFCCNQLNPLPVQVSKEATKTGVILVLLRLFVWFLCSYYLVNTIAR